MNLCKIGLHKWKTVYRQYQDSFLGEKFLQKYEYGRICLRCGKVQIHDCSIVGCWWITLEGPRKEILLRKIIDKGGYYLLDRDVSLQYPPPVPNPPEEPKNRGIDGMV